jgi:hypothetical protein
LMKDRPVMNRLRSKPTVTQSQQESLPQELCTQGSLAFSFRRGCGLIQRAIGFVLVGVPDHGDRFCK